MTKSLNLWLINIVLSAFFMSCTEKSDTGIDLQSDASILKANLIDTFTVNISTVLEKENIASSGSTVLLTGAYTDQYTDQDSDQYLGKVWSNASFQLVPSAEYTLGTNPVCDSAILTLAYIRNTFYDENGNEKTVYHYYGDIYAELNLEIYQLEDGFQSIDEKIYTTLDVLATKPHLEGETGNIVHEPESGNPLTIPLDKDSFGNDVLTNYSNDYNTFLTNVKGLQIKPIADSDASIIGFNTNTDVSFVTVYYSNDEGESKSLILEISEVARRFNHIEADHTGTLISSLTNEGDTISSKSTENKMYLQTSTGIRALIEIPYLDDFLTANPGVLINKVELILPIDPYSAINSSADEPPLNIALHQTTDENLIFRDSYGNPTYITNEGDLTGANKDQNYYIYSDTDKNYRMNLGLYVQSYAADPSTDFRIIVSPYGEGTSVNRAVLFDTEYSDEKSTLKFYYTKRDE